jgi:hypothetical protein
MCHRAQAQTFREQFFQVISQHLKSLKAEGVRSKAKTLELFIALELKLELSLSPCKFRKILGAQNSPTEDKK